MKAISKMVEQLKAWAAGLVTATKVSDRVGLLDRMEDHAWGSLTRRDAGPADGVSGKAADQEIEQHLRTVLLCQQNKMALRIGSMVEAFGPQISAIPGILRASIEMSAKKPGEHALLKRFFECPTEGEATAAGIDLVVDMLANKEGVHPLDPEIRALRAEGHRIDDEISKLRDAGWYRTELEGKRERLAGLQAERAKRADAEVQDTAMLRLIPHYLEQRVSLQDLESRVASSGEFATLDKLVGEIVVIEHLAQWRDGSPASLDGLLKVVARNSEFVALSDKLQGSEADYALLAAAVLNVHACARNASGPGVRFTVNPEGLVVGVWSLPSEVLEAFFEKKRMAEAFDATKE